MKTDKVNFIKRIKRIIVFPISILFSLIFWIFWAINELSSKGMDLVQEIVTKMFNWALD